MNITGRLIDDSGNPLKGVTVQAWIFHLMFGPRHIGSAVTTGDDGTFSISITITTDITSGVIKINLHLRVFSKVGRILLISENRDLAFIGQDWPIGDLEIHRNTLSGWRVTNRDPDGNRPFYSEANNLLPMIDNELAWSVLNQAVLASTQEVNFLSFYYQVGTVRVGFGPDEPKEGEQTVGLRLEDSLLKINRDGILATVRILSRMAVIIPKIEIGLAMSSATSVEVFFLLPSSQPNTVATRSYECSVRLPMHAKMITFDGVEAHIMGSPLDQHVPLADASLDHAGPLLEVGTGTIADGPPRPDTAGAASDGAVVFDTAVPPKDTASPGPDVAIGGLPRRVIWHKEPSGPDFSRGMSGTSNTDIWVGGSTGDVWHSTGNGQWTRRDIVTAGDVRGFWGSAPNNVYAATYINRVWRWNGSSWDQFDFEGGVTFTSVWGSSATDIYAVGGGIFRSAGDGMWRLEPVNQFNPMESVWGSGSSDVWIALNLGKILHSKGDGKWAMQVGGVTQSPNVAIWGTGPNNIYLLRGGEVVHSTGNGAWVPQPMDRLPTEGLNCICGSGPNDVYIGTQGGRVFRSTGDGRWHAERFLPMDGRVLDVAHCWAAPNGEVFTVTDDGTYHGRPAP